MITEKQNEIYIAIREFIEVHGYSPTYRELGRELEMNHVTVFNNVIGLAKLGLLKHKPKIARSITLTNYGE